MLSNKRYFGTNFQKIRMIVIFFLILFVKSPLYGENIREKCRELLTTDNPTEAIEIAKVAIKDYPTFDAYYCLSVAYSMVKRPNLVIATLDEGRKYIVSKEQRLKWHNLMGTAYFQNEKYDEALYQYKATLNLAKELNDRNAEAGSLLNIGNIFAAKGEYKSALSYFERCLENNPSDENIKRAVREAIKDVRSKM